MQNKAIATSSNRWNVIDLDYFNSHLDKSYDKGEIVIVDKDLYFRSVILFIERIKDIVVIKSNALIRINLNISLRGIALKWYIIELFNLKRIDLRNNSRDIEKWYNVLLARFKELLEIALSHLIFEKYTLIDTRAR